MCSRFWAQFCGCYWLFILLEGYALGMGTNSWVIAGNNTWGLWKWCELNGTDDPVCHDINPGDSPGYFEGVRTLALVTALLVVIFMICLCFSAHSRGPPAVTVLLYCVSVATTAALMVTNYKDDDRWKDSNPRLGWSFWLASICAGVYFFFCLIMVKARTYKNTPPRLPSEESRRCTLCCCVTNLTVPTVTRRPSNASSLSIDTGKRITIFHSQTSNLSSTQAGQINLSFEPDDFSNTRL